MSKKKVTLLDRAKGDLVITKTMMGMAAGDDVVMDICAYHSQQCVEKIAKFLILMQGDEYSNDHRSDIYLEDLRNAEVVALIKQISSKIDYWTTSILYHHTIQSNERMVNEVVDICETLIDIAERSIPEEAPDPGPVI